MISYKHVWFSRVTDLSLPECYDDDVDVHGVIVVMTAAVVMTMTDDVDDDDDEWSKYPFYCQIDSKCSRWPPTVSALK